MAQRLGAALAYGERLNIVEIGKPFPDVPTERMNQAQLAIADKHRV
jgi:hypothetical protein